jgi:ribose transport system ATP-binding protein
LVLAMTIAQNITLASLLSHTRLLLIRNGAEMAVSRQQRTRLRIRAPGDQTPVATLSGGNQQKVVLGKWLSMRPRLIIFDEPTRGIDVGSKSEIYTLMRELADRGVAILMISSDMEEVIGVSDRIAVMHEGAVSGILQRSQFSEYNVLRLATGQTPENA